MSCLISNQVMADPGASAMFVAGAHTSRLEISLASVSFSFRHNLDSRNSARDPSTQMPTCVIDRPLRDFFSRVVFFSPTRLAFSCDRDDTELTLSIPFFHSVSSNISLSDVDATLCCPVLSFCWPSSLVGADAKKPIGE